MGKNNNRRKGHEFERLLAKLFRDMGFPYCKTSREASRLYDNCGIDLWGIPYLVQAKKVRANINYGLLLKEIRENTSKNFPPEDPIHSYPIFIFHRKEKYRLVIMEENEFIELLKKVHDRGEVKGDTSV